MKANQSFKQADEAVSPVIGVILMVAITVVLAAVVFVLVSDLGDTGTKAPSMAFQADDDDGTVTVVKAPVNNVLVYGTDLVAGGTCDWTMVNGATAGLTGDVTGGDIISTDCTSGQTITFTHVASGTLVYSHEFP